MQKSLKNNIHRMFSRKSRFFPVISSLPVLVVSVFAANLYFGYRNYRRLGELL